MKKPTPAPTNRIAEVRKRYGLTQSQLADKVGVHWITISKLERGLIQFSDEWKERLGEALNIDPDLFLPANRRLTTIEVAGEILPGGIIEQYSEKEGVHTYTIWNGAFHALNKVWYYVNTTALEPLFHDEDLLCFARNDDIDPANLVNRFSLIMGEDRVGNSLQVFGYPHLSARADRYTIAMLNGPPIPEFQIHVIMPLVSVFYNIPEIDDLAPDVK
ncbi:helix-turn-helix transcriptional regulator [Agrobacterium rhizogenes]|nr:helix-turn-helix transcriptional regulator [Rhizobium rhizogenes]